MNGHIKSIVINGIRFFLILLWVYAASAKLLAFRQSRVEMHSQVFSPAVADFLTWAIPVSELIIAITLISKKFQKTGFILSVFFLTIFSGYILLIVSNAFNHIPCSCAGIFRNISWHTQLAFNMLVLTVSITALYLKISQKGGNMGKA